MKDTLINIAIIGVLVVGLGPYIAVTVGAAAYLAAEFAIPVGFATIVIWYFFGGGSSSHEGPKK